MLRNSEKYIEHVVSKIVELKNTQVENINKAAELVAETCMKDGRFYVFGSGHSHMVAEEIYIRAGGLAFVKAILTPELMLHQMPNKSTFLERIDGYSSAILNLYKADNNDTIMIISNSGRNNVPVEMAMAAQEKKMKVISITSLRHSKETTSRHRSGKKLYELSDVVIDNLAEKGDASFRIEGCEDPVGPISDIMGITIAQSIITQAVTLLVEKGVKPPIFRSSNVDGADEYNNILFDKYYGYWK